MIELLKKLKMNGSKSTQIRVLFFYFINKIKQVLKSQNLLVSRLVTRTGFEPMNVCVKGI